MASTALNGTPLEFDLDDGSTPGTPAIAGEAKHIREALVRQATPQKSCPMVEIVTTTFCHPMDSD